jgi:hypothetical protein
MSSFRNGIVSPLVVKIGWMGGACRHGFHEPVEAQPAPCCDFDQDLAGLSFEEVEASSSSGTNTER